MYIYIVLKEFRVSIKWHIFMEQNQVEKDL